MVRNSDQYYLFRTGLLLGAVMPNDWVEDLMKLESLDDIRKEINTELGTNIERGMPCQLVFESVRDHLDEYLLFVQLGIVK